MKITDCETNQEIDIPLPEEEYLSYKKEAGEVVEEKMTLAQLKTVFALAVAGFLKGDISSDGLAAICNGLFDQAAKYRDEDKEFFDVIIAGSELAFYIRRPHLSQQFNSFIKTVLEYKPL